MKKTFAALMLAAVCMPGFGGTAFAEEKIYTLDGDFDEGLLINVHHDAPNNDQLQLYDGDTKPFPFINVAASARGTVIRADTETGEIMGEYKSAPEGRGLDPSRTSVDVRGNVWTGNRGASEDGKGSAVKIGIVVGGTRCDGRNADGTVIENSDGDYVWLDPDKLTYSTCVDRDGDGLIRTSRGLGDILPWSDVTDGAGGADGIVEDAVDECILIYQRLPDAPVPRHISVDINSDVWVGGYPNEPRMFHKLDGETGAIIESESFDARTFGCGGYGGLVSDGILWSASLYDHALLRYDPVSRTGQCIEVLHSYGLSADNDGFIWNNMREIDSITKINPDTGDYAPGFPVLTGGEYSRGVVVTPKNNHAWSANSKSNTVTRLDSNGSLIAVVPVGEAPTGVTVDAAGKVWVTNLLSDNMMRIDPASNTVDLVVDLGEGAGPYNYSDMTGIVLLGHPPIGFWNVVYESDPCSVWDRIFWNSQEDTDIDSSIVVEVRFAVSKVGLATADFIPVVPVITKTSEGYYHEADLSGMKGRFVEVRTTLTTNAEIGERDLPVLQDLTLKYSPLSLTVEDIPDQEYSYGFQPINLDDYLTFDPAGDYYDDVHWDYSDLPEGWSVTIDENNVATVTCPEDETEDVSITFSAQLSWGAEVCSDASVSVLFEANHPPVLCDSD